jgi:small conductance mechanosensitive channel
MDILALSATPLAGVILRLVLIGLLAWLAAASLRLAARRLESRLEKTVASAEQIYRLKTLVQVGRRVIQISVLMLAGLMALQALNINIAPLLASVGVAGLALSLGAQTLIKDYIGGILILAENQFSIGDVIEVGDARGTVERITLRATYMRDIEGKLHVISNGDIRQVSNLTVDWAQAVVEINIDYDADMNVVMRALEAAARQAQEDETIRADVLEPPQVVGWAGFKDWAVLMRIIAKTMPGSQWKVATTLRKYAVEALRGAEVRIAVPSALPSGSSQIDKSEE